MADLSAGPARDIVLVVDDSPDTLRLLTEALEQAGATVLVALEGEAALSIAAEVTPDIVLMDAMMPGMDGFETTRRLKEDANLRHVPVIFMTGLSETEHVVRGLESGGVDYVTKPIVPDELIARMRVHLANARAAQSARAALDTAGRFLLAADRTGRVLWSTPQAIRLLNAALPSEGGRFVLPRPLAAFLAGGAADSPAPGPTALPSAAGPRLSLSFLGTIGEDEHLFRLTAEEDGGEEAVLRRQFGLTPREAEVLLWITRGKANRDIAEILTLSPRTVNKHLETIFEKLGVENRASAAIIALKALGER
ncbi:response regulator transcription factor [Aurantimonas sp. Leaf443]|uniref:response regulator transcription factor n=1 Tax=Aurantimonas sp. Leaf443 TaxID=1736378 RepID=UPI0006F309E3|nr:response regulator transcription factor [Aurantimonas sp. Leaf443]KQT85216.1 LuxR family transcriptional regulator [Aurantimonas sp. Leaf443]